MRRSVDAHCCQPHPRLRWIKVDLVLLIPEDLLRGIVKISTKSCWVHTPVVRYGCPECNKTALTFTLRRSTSLNGHSHVHDSPERWQQGVMLLVLAAALQPDCTPCQFINKGTAQAVCVSSVRHHGRRRGTQALHWHYCRCRQPTLLPQSPPHSDYHRVRLFQAHPLKAPPSSLISLSA